MDKETSTYLDGARFVAAFAVMLCHVDDYMVKGVIPFVDHLGIESVGVFFVLSGFVIGYATEFREKDLRTYVVNRAARLYSVVIPCLVATLILDTVGHHYLHSIYYSHESFLREVSHMAVSCLFLGYSWLLPHGILPGNDGPFWSLYFEVPYYVLFGTVWYLRGLRRFVMPVLAFLVFGPYMLIFFPLWLLGLGLYHLFHHIALKPAPARFLLALSVLLWIVFESLLKYFDVCPNVTADIKAGPLLLYGAGICFMVSVTGFHFSKISLAGIARPVRWLAGATFTLYLLHFPLAWFLNGAMARSPAGNWPAVLRWAILIAVTFGLVLALAQVTERRKHVWRRGIEQIFTATGRMFGSRTKLETIEPNQPLF